MALSKRGKIVVAVGSVAAVAVASVVGFALATGTSPAEVLSEGLDTVTGKEEPVLCPLTGEKAPGGTIPDHGVVAVKVDNTDEAYPQAGLEDADIVYEELVEGGITRFIAVFQCEDSRRVGPVRSGRTTDPAVLSQFGKPVLAFSGGAGKVRKEIKRSPVIGLDETSGAEAFRRDASRAAPHNLFVDTDRLLKVAKSKEGAPDPVFSYGEWEGKSKKARSLTLSFSVSNEVVWEWNRPEARWARFEETTPNVLENGDQILAENVVVQMVKVSMSDILDVTGTPSPEVKLTGKGKAYIFRDGRVIVAKWSRPSLDDVTTFEAKGEEVVLAPGQTWVELFPTDEAFEFSKK